MFQKILVPTALDDSNKAALKFSAELALHNKASVTLLHVIELIKDADFDELKAFYEKLHRQAEQSLQSMLSSFTDRHIPCQYEIIYGNRVMGICDYIEKNKPDLLVLQSHQVQPGTPGRGWGTISYQVSILATCPVLLVK